MSLTDFTLCELDEKIALNLFDCGDQDLNDFLLNESIAYQHQLMANTFLFQNHSIAAFFSISNDTLIDKGSTKIWNRLQRKIKNTKRRKIYPAIKIGRLGVSVDAQGYGLGKEILRFIIGLALFVNKSASRFLIVDAYNNDRTIKFYTDNGFQFLQESDEKEKTRIMFLDLLPYKSAAGT